MIELILCIALGIVIGIYGFAGILRIAIYIIDTLLAIGVYITTGILVIILDSVSFVTHLCTNNKKE